MKSIFLTSCFGLLLSSTFALGLNSKPVNAQTLEYAINEGHQGHKSQNDQRKHADHDHSRHSKDKK